MLALSAGSHVAFVPARTLRLAARHRQAAVWSASGDAADLPLIRSSKRRRRLAEEELPSKQPGAEQDNSAEGAGLEPIDAEVLLDDAELPWTQHVSDEDQFSQELANKYLQGLEELDREAVREMAREQGRRDFKDIPADKPPGTKRSKFSPPSKVSPEEEEAWERRSALILKLSDAGEAIEQVIEDNRDEIDERLVEHLEGRLKIARAMKEKKHSIEAWQVLYERMRAELERNQASPAERLLDRLMQAISPHAGRLLAERQRDVSLQLEEAFTLPGTNVDVMAAAMAVVQGETDELERAAASFVPKSALMQEGRAVLAFAQQNVEELEAALESGEAKGHEDAVRAAIEDKQETMQWLSQVLELADDIPSEY